MIRKIEFRASIAPIMSGIRTGGDGLRLTLDIPETDVQDAVALIALRNVPLMVTIEVDTRPTATRIHRPDDVKQEKPKKEKKAKEPKGEWGKYWQAMYKAGALNSPDIKTVLETEQDREIDDVKAALKLWFGVESLTFISPIDFEQWCGKYNLANLITISRNAAAETCNV